jgi:large subunit ribosomal protein L4
VDLPSEIFEAPIKMDLMHQAFVRQMANARAGTRSTKSRAEVSGGGRKPWRQKGTGRARHGSIRSPIWVGGGKVHTPKPKSFRARMPKKMRRAALRSALSVKWAEEKVVVVKDLNMEAPKTKEMVETLARLGPGDSWLILLPAPDKVVEKSIRNLPSAKTLDARYLNVRDLLKYERVVLPLGAVDVIRSYLG